MGLSNKIKIGQQFKRPSGVIVVVTEINSDGFFYTDVDCSGCGGWHSFSDGKYLKSLCSIK